MESLSTNTTNTEDQIHHLLLILTQIKQFNSHVQDVLEEASPKNKENVEELIFALIPLMQDLIRTFCEKINRTTETLKPTLHLLNRIQDTFQDMSSVTGKKILALYTVY